MNNKKYTVKEFCEKYNKQKSDDTRLTFVKERMNAKYVPYEVKVAICEKIVENTYYVKDENNGMKTKKLRINSPAQRMLFGLQLVEQYTDIKIDFKHNLDDFNMLSESGAMVIILTLIPEFEFKEFDMLLNMVCSDVIQNEYETHAFISNQIERFGELTGVVLKPAIERLNDILLNMDEKTIDKMVNKLNNPRVLNGLKVILNSVE